MSSCLLPDLCSNLLFHSPARRLRRPSWTTAINGNGRSDPTREVQGKHSHRTTAITPRIFLSFFTRRSVCPGAHLSSQVQDDFNCVSAAITFSSRSATPFEFSLTSTIDDVRKTMDFVNTCTLGAFVSLCFDFELCLTTCHVQQPKHLHREGSHRRRGLAYDRPQEEGFYE